MTVSKLTISECQFSARLICGYLLARLKKKKKIIFKFFVVERFISTGALMLVSLARLRQVAFS